MGVEVDLGGKAAVVTGGGGGIGAAICDALAAAGAHVVVVDIDENGANESAARIVGNGGSAQAVIADVRDREQVAAMGATALAHAGRVDVLVNNVGHYIRPTAFLEGDDEHWSALHDVNFVHALHCCRALVPSMVERGSGSVVNVASVEGLRGYPWDPVYGAYKAAMAHFTRCLALEVASKGVRVNAIAPDVTQTIQVDYESLVPPEQRHLWEIWVPIGRVGTAADNADVVLFLASDLSRFVTGHVIPTDGGTVLAGGWFRTADSGRWTNRPRNP
jgi:NAD(P)-dependent dehydrogenase (short-subunit alcohol dehydrogenase family)